MSLGHLTGTIIGGRYRLGERLGQGGMGVVYTATQESLARPVALKVLQPMLVQDGDAIMRFKAEAERAGRLAHPHIVQIFDFGHEPGGSAWIAMELLTGESLATRIERGRLSEAEVVRIAKETLSALEAAHAANLVHRDLKPDNIFLADVKGIGASVKVLDFGIAKLLDDENVNKLTATGMLLGTPLYMAPEQARGSDVDQRADLYALGAVLYEALTGRPPFNGKNYNALLYSVLNEEPPSIESLRPGISSPLAAVIARAMEKLPAARWQSAEAMADALRTIVPSEQVPSVRPVSHAAIATAPTMATPVPAEPPSAQPSSRATPPTRATPALEQLPSPAPEPSASPTEKKPERPFKWWPMALSGGLLAAAALSFVVGGGAMMSSGSSPDPSMVPTDLVDTGGVAPSGVAPSGGSPNTIEPHGGVLTPVIAPPGPDVVDAGAVKLRRPPRPRDIEPTPTPTPPPAVRGVHVQFRGGTLPGMAGGHMGVAATLEAAGGWSTCWPASLAAPPRTQGRVFIVDVAPDGRVRSAVPAPRNDEPHPFSTCIAEKLRRVTFQPTTTGESANIRVGFQVVAR